MVPSRFANEYVNTSVYMWVWNSEEDSHRSNLVDENKTFSRELYLLFLNLLHFLSSWVKLKSNINIYMAIATSVIRYILG